MLDGLKTGLCFVAGCAALIAPGYIVMRLFGGHLSHASLASALVAYVLYFSLLIGAWYKRHLGQTAPAS